MLLDCCCFKFWWTWLMISNDHNLHNTFTPAITSGARCKGRWIKSYSLLALVVVVVVVVVVSGIQIPPFGFRGQFSSEGVVFATQPCSPLLGWLLKRRWKLDIMGDKFIKNNFGQFPFSRSQPRTNSLEPSVSSGRKNPSTVLAGARGPVSL